MASKMDDQGLREDQMALLRDCSKISAVKLPNNRGSKFLARLIYIVDADTIHVAGCVDGRLQRHKIRVTLVDAAEINHKDGDRIVTPYEQALGSVTKSYVLNRLSPADFKVTTTDEYNDRVQKKVFDAKPVMLLIDCPMTDTKGKEIDLDPYGRDLGAVTVLENNSAEKGWDLAQDLISKELVDLYEGGTKKRSFMRSTAFLDPLEAVLGSPTVEQLKSLYANLSEEDKMMGNNPQAPEVAPQNIPVTTKTGPEDKPVRPKRTRKTATEITPEEAPIQGRPAKKGRAV